MHDLAKSYYSHGQHEWAVQLAEQIVEVRKRVLGAENEGAICSEHYLAWYYISQ